jgi:thiol-disulfide isomerase/thioredoxin
LLVDFTGSDWCGWCIKLNREVFSKPEFQEYANKNLVLLEIDFPRSKTQSDTVKKQNEELATQYQIQGFPTVVVLNEEGRKVGELATWKAGRRPSSRSWKSCARVNARKAQRPALLAPLLILPGGFEGALQCIR